MALSDCIVARRPSDVGGSDKGELRDALYAHLDSAMIASFAREDRQRARREILAVLELELRRPEFSLLGDSEGQRLIGEVADMVLGLGPIEPLIDDPSVTEVMVNGPDKVFFERDGRLHSSDIIFIDEAQLRLVIDRIVAPLGRRIDEQCPMVSARLPQGHRVNAVIPPLALDGPMLTIRKFRETVFSLDELCSMGSLSAPMATMLSWAVKARRNIAVSGGTGGGKTTLLNALSLEIDPAERIITIEDSAELRFSHHPNVVRLEARPRNSEGAGEVTIRDLVTNSLRMRPDRIVVGECRGAEAIDMLQAMNTGHDGSMTTLHANSPAEVVSRLVMMARYGSDLPVDVIEEQIGSALDLIVQQDRTGSGERRISSLFEVVPVAHKVELRPLVIWDRSERAYHYVAAPRWVDDLPYLGVATGEEVREWRRLMEPS